MLCDNCKLNFNNKGGLVKHKKSCIYTDKDVKYILQDYIDGLSIRKVSEKYKISKSYVEKVISDNKRNSSEASKNARKLYPEKYKHSEYTKKKLRDIRLKWMKENPEKTAWRLSNPSYPEKIFISIIEEMKLYERFTIIREKSIYPYYIDFAFMNEKVAVEIDGSQHKLDERKANDQKKDKLLMDNGWLVYRINAFYFIKNTKEVIDKLLFFLEKKEKNYEEVGFYEQKTLNQIKKENLKKERTQYGLTIYEIEKAIKQRRVERPSYEILLKDIEEMGYLKTGKKYNVSDNSIRKWVKFYQKYGQVSK
jgi:very-short-patch-repair endonuclease